MKNFSIVDYSDLCMIVNVDGKILKSYERGDYSSRDVFLFADFVVKLDRKYNDERKDYLSANQTATEIEFYEKIEEGDENYFAKLLDYGLYQDRFFIVQERLIEAGEYLSDDEEGIAYNIIRKYDLKNDVYPGRNSMLTEGGWKIYDVGFPQSSADKDFELRKAKGMLW